jgi:hypothetical protein
MPTSPLKAGTPLWAVLGVAFINSLGTGVIVNGIYFLTGFDKVGNYAIGAAFGVAYIIAAFNASRVARTLRRLVPRLSSRAILAIIMLTVGAICNLPWLSGGGLHPWVFWVIGVTYGLVTGVMWPLIEGYVSGGRRGQRLRFATGQFNIWWAGAIVIAFVAMAPLIKDPFKREMVLAGLGAVHVLGILLLLAFKPEPGVAGEVDHEPHPEVYPRLLAIFRIQLPTSYMVMGALSPFLPSALSTLGAPELLHTPIAATWLATRVITFLAMERWHGWHGRWWVSIAGPTLTLAGFGACILSPVGGATTAGLATLIAGLCVFGIGVGMIYTAALYYAMEVGHEEVASGGTHEALIGAGYLTGPLAGLSVALLVRQGTLAPSSFEPVKLGVVVALCVLMGVVGGFTLSRQRAGLQTGKSEP